MVDHLWGGWCELRIYVWIENVWCVDCCTSLGGDINRFLLASRCVITLFFKVFFSVGKKATRNIMTTDVGRNDKWWCWEEEYQWCAAKMGLGVVSQGGHALSGGSRVSSGGYGFLQVGMVSLGRMVFSEWLGALKRCVGARRQLRNGSDIHPGNVCVCECVCVCVCVCISGFIHGVGNTNAM